MKFIFANQELDFSVEDFHKASNVFMKNVIPGTFPKAIIRPPGKMHLSRYDMPGVIIEGTPSEFEELNDLQEKKKPKLSHSSSSARHNNIPVLVPMIPQSQTSIPVLVVPSHIQNQQSSVEINTTTSNNLSQISTKRKYNTGNNIPASAAITQSDDSELFIHRPRRQVRIKNMPQESESDKSDDDDYYDDDENYEEKKVLKTSQNKQEVTVTGSEYIYKEFSTILTEYNGKEYFRASDIYLEGKSFDGWQQSMSQYSESSDVITMRFDSNTITNKTSLRGKRVAVMISLKLLNEINQAILTASWENRNLNFAIQRIDLRKMKLAISLLEHKSNPPEIPSLPIQEAPQHLVNELYNAALLDQTAAAAASSQ